jgi:hypothetical protein
VAACAPADPSPTCVRSSATACISVPARSFHAPLLATIDCKSSLDCPPGARCSRISGELRRCALDGLPAPNALYDGFDVERFELIVSLDQASESRGARISWRGPASTRLVRCAVFGCTPEIAPVCSEDEKENPNPEIINYSRCVLAEFKTSRLEQTWDLEPLGDELFGSTSESRSTRRWCALENDDTEPNDRRLPRLLSQLTAACWFYDESSLIGATALTPIPVARAAAIGRNYVQQTCPTQISILEERSCVLNRGAERETFGTCHVGACAKRCASDEPTSCGDGDTCVLPELGVIGVCVRTSTTGGGQS